jgi:hypothetical protein
MPIVWRLDATCLRYVVSADANSKVDEREGTKAVAGHPPAAWRLTIDM